MNPLHEAAKTGNLAELTRQLDNGADVNLKEEKDVTPLLISVINGHTDVVHCLLDRGANVNARDSNGGSPLMAAAAFRRVDILEMLLRKDADANAKNSHGQSALAFAIESSGPSCMGLSMAEAKALWSSSNNANAKIVRLLIANGADVNATTDAGVTPLMSAGNLKTLYCEIDAIGILKYLVDNGAKINAVDSRGDSVLKYWISSSNWQIVPTMIEMGAVVHTANCDGETPLHLAVKREYEDIVQCLLAKGADGNAKDSDGKTPLDVALASLARIDYRNSYVHYTSVKSLISLLKPDGEQGPTGEATTQDRRADNEDRTATQRKADNRKWWEFWK
jgi:ankyrin repeat protein